MLPFQSLLVSYLFLSWGGLGFDEWVEAFCLFRGNQLHSWADRAEYPDNQNMSPTGTPIVLPSSRHLENVLQNCSIRAGGWTVEWTHSGMGLGVCGGGLLLLLFCLFNNWELRNLTQQINRLENFGLFQLNPKT